MMPVPKRLRFEILRRDNHACRYCGATAPGVALHVDHVVPEALGGGSTPDNLVTACADCNHGKSSTPADAALVEDVRQDAARWAKAMEQVSAIRNQQIQHDDALWDWFKEAWCKWSVKDWRGNAAYIPWPNNAGATIRQFIGSGLTKDEIESLIDVAMNARHVDADDTWRYFCGCVWRRIRENQEMAAALIAAEADRNN
jgi:hypothetical protein